MASDLSDRDLIESDVLAFLDRNEKKELLRFVTVGSVDDGKSTLIGRLLHDTKGVYEDQLADATRTSETGEKAIDFARITDGLRAEREQGITIDVAYRYFSTPRRKFIIADTPGHVQYTRNMATGASTANVGMLLIDARLGVLQQSRRHAFIGSLIRIPHLFVAVNKMDLVDWSRERFDEIAAEFGAFCAQLDFRSVTFVPISALMGSNIVERSDRAPWYTGPTVLEFLETVEIGSDRNLSDFRYPVQYVIRPNLDYRGFAGRIASGAVRRGDAIKVLPSGKTSRVASIDTYDGPLDFAWAPMSVVLRLEDEIDISRGDLIVHQGADVSLGRTFEASIVWMHETSLDPQKSYLLKHGTQYVRANIDAVVSKFDLTDLHEVDAGNRLELNEIGRVRLTTHRPIAFDPYAQKRATGAFIVIDSLTNNTVGAGMIREAEGPVVASDVGGQTEVSPAERAKRLGQRGVAVWLAGRPGAGRSTLAFALERRLFDLGHVAAVLDADDPRYPDAGDPVVIGRRLVDAGLLAVVTADDLDTVAFEGRALTVHVDVPAAVTRARGRPTVRFEAPEADLVVANATRDDLDDAVEAIVEKLREVGALS